MKLKIIIYLPDGGGELELESVIATTVSAEFSSNEFADLVSLITLIPPGRCFWIFLLPAFRPRRLGGFTGCNRIQK